MIARRDGLSWKTTIATEALRFFSPFRQDAVLPVLGIERTGYAQVLNARQFADYLGRRDVRDVWTHPADIERLLNEMVRVGLLTNLGRVHRTPVLAHAYSTSEPPTTAQFSGDLWLADVLGAELIIHRYSAAAVPLTGTNAAGDVGIGSGILVDDAHVLTNAHVVEDMTLDDEIEFPTALVPGSDGEVSPARRVRVVDVKVHGRIDVAVVSVEPSGNDQTLAPPRGMAWRAPEWADETYVFGYPPVPTAASAYLTVQRGDVVNPAMVAQDGTSYSLYSAITRPGNSGGPIVAHDGRVIGLVAREAFDRGRPNAAPFYCAIPTGELVKALNEIGFDDLLCVEDWERPMRLEFHRSPSKPNDAQA
ncbi:S1 family peptidase [Nocardia araoensis]|uniref:S1 family peptidase n=1 Tax=Nocardia araoensis TaxID=228600 RepID=UPI0009FC5DFA|nr:serine protease [Nocardia araoensis]